MVHPTFSRALCLLASVAAMVCAAPVTHANSTLDPDDRAIEPTSITTPNSVATPAGGPISLGTVCGISGPHNPHLITRDGKAVAHSKVTVKWNKPAIDHVAGTMAGDTLGPGQFGPKVPLQVTTESRTVAKGQTATFYVPKLGTSSVQCKKGYYYQATTAIYATITLLAKTTVDVFSSASAKLC